LRNWFCVSLLLLLCSSPTLAQTSGADKLRGQIKHISHAAQGKVGVSLALIETGETVTLNGEQHFPMQSVYKLPIAMAVLHQVDKGALKLNQKVRVKPTDLLSERQHSPIRDKYPKGVELSLAELLQLMVSESDGTACDVLLRVVGGARFVTRYLRGLGLNDAVVATTEKEMGRDEFVQYRNWASPLGMTQLLRALQEGHGLSATSRALLLRFLTESPTGPRRIKGLLPTGTTVAHKTGTDGTRRGLTRATNDVGIITLPNGQHLAVVVFVADSRAKEATREGVIAKIARAAWDFWSRRP
jgi:beta-lactamase class A